MHITDDKIKISRIKSYHENVSRLNSMLKETWVSYDGMNLKRIVRKTGLNILELI